MIETLRLRHFTILAEDRLEDRTVTVEYVEVDHWSTQPNPDGSERRKYEVYVDHGLAGTIEQTTESTDRKYGRLRRPGKGRVAWSWRSADGKRENSPGLYARTRRIAVAKLVGYSEGEVVKALKP